MNADDLKVKIEPTSEFADEATGAELEYLAPFLPELVADANRILLVQEKQ